MYLLGLVTALIWGKAEKSTFSSFFPALVFGDMG